MSQSGLSKKHMSRQDLKCVRSFGELHVKDQVWLSKRSLGKTFRPQCRFDTSASGRRRENWVRASVQLWELSQPARWEIQQPWPLRGIPHLSEMASFKHTSHLLKNIFPEIIFNLAYIISCSSLYQIILISLQTCCIISHLIKMFPWSSFPE